MRGIMLNLHINRMRQELVNEPEMQRMEECLHSYETKD